MYREKLWIEDYLLKKIDGQKKEKVNDMNYFELKINVVDVIKEAQLKLGYERTKISLYYPLEALNNLLEQDLSVAQMQQTLEKYAAELQMQLDQYMEKMSNGTDLTKEFDFKQNRIEISHKEERFCITIPEEGVQYVHENVQDNGFLRAFLDCVSQHGCTIEQITSVFQKYSDAVVVKKADYQEFDYLLYFQNGKPDQYRYCIHFEGEHAIYHRFTKKEYDAFDF